MSRVRGAGRPVRGTRGARGTLGAIALCALLTAGCDDQIKYIELFSTMSQQVSVEAGEEAPRSAVPGTMPIDGERAYGLLEADTMLVSPIVGDSVELALGEERFAQFCTPCHGAEGRGDGPVVGPNRIPALPTLDLTTDRAMEYSDGYLWGMIANGRGLMPSYRRIPTYERWQIVAFVRQLQRDYAAAAGEAAGGGDAANGADGGAGGGDGGTP
jgi:mono/diheme cytochrome c family protein